MNKLKVGKPKPDIDYGPFYETVMFCGRELKMEGTRDSCGAWYHVTGKDDPRIEISTSDALGSIKTIPSETFATTVIFSDGSGHSYYGPDIEGINLQAAVDGLEQKLRNQITAIQQFLTSPHAPPKD